MAISYTTSVDVTVMGWLEQRLALNQGSLPLLHAGTLNPDAWTTSQCTHLWTEHRPSSTVSVKEAGAESWHSPGLSQILSPTSEVAMKVPRQLLDIVQNTIARYNLIHSCEEVVVAFSGGKDSIGLCLCLRELGYPLRAIAIDMGYEAGWGKRIVSLGATLDLTVNLVDLRSLRPGHIQDSEYRQISRRLKVLDSIKPSSSTNVTPCTHCYNSKVIALDNAVRQFGIFKIAFAHHLTDACASLVKEALLRIDRFDRNHAVYLRSNFESLVYELATETASYPTTEHNIVRRIDELVQDRRVDTDEPPRQPLRIDNDGVEIIRPLFGLWEPALLSLSRDLRITPEGSGCGHGATLNTETPREMVHYRVLRHASQEFGAHIAALVMDGLDQDGSTTTRARYRRTEDLGVGYKATSATDKL